MAIQAVVQHVGDPRTDAVRVSSLNGSKVFGDKDRKWILGLWKDSDVALPEDMFYVLATIFEGEVEYNRLLMIR